MPAIRYLNLGTKIAVKCLAIKERRLVCLVCGLDILTQIEGKGKQKTEAYVGFALIFSQEFRLLQAFPLPQQICSIHPY